MTITVRDSRYNALSVMVGVNVSARVVYFESGDNENMFCSMDEIFFRKTKRRFDSFPLSIVLSVNICLVFSVCAESAKQSKDSAIPS